MKPNELEIEVNMIIAFNGNKYQCLGTYKTQKRAKQVLHEIQAYINEGYGDVYEMPED